MTYDEDKKNEFIDGDEGKELQYLVRGAVLACRAGSSSSRLNLPVCHGVYAKSHPMVNKMDYQPGVNIMPFGKCSITDKPCSPSIIGPWLKEHKKTVITNAQAITMDAFLVCTKGGLIEAQTSGQES